MIILGIDPGLNNTGYGLIKCEKKKIDLIDYGCILTYKKDTFGLRIKKIYYKIKELIEKYNPHEVAIEEIFFNKNVRSALTVSKVHGMVAITVALMGLELYEYTPLQIKQATVGNGRAEKYQVQSMVKILLNLSEIPQPDHAADALAVAICHTHTKY
ncbi:crossover junction endodeoxyribonuclease RuvC [Candidatus Atribacteria bacterium RBG_19FT_COMBO_35_14]|uniref:Crossover junction endodeoxyribonuclease RuvC n=1 Tax=Candidatus Sediminicultor quintus TaxID=1797291 RepID=A0A1F5A7R4_9BACT|nr:MAG: crossover junction endodeoxyribonuclease RuvC [Candidatus Atribacteria bacterium RBG_19FT_COMBO_35_14]OGD36054.1 MAG: crossover junction endodeoxyribonuclease RuvC [Candidatus Atribacteria bacterium RBG_16_35_8]